MALCVTVQTAQGMVISTVIMHKHVHQQKKCYQMKIGVCETFHLTAILFVGYYGSFGISAVIRNMSESVYGTSTCRHFPL
ncbi:hypothetical protein BD777DRAFT_127324 [Yarrowia lipolytica]|nr:hypothetical protein BD777DRAFT_127324 [Yarrowia lipolytica]